MGRDDPARLDSRKMSLVLNRFRRKRTVSSLRSLNSVLNMTAALGVIPYSLRGENVAFGSFRLPYNIFCTFILPFLAGCVLIFPNNMLQRSSFSMFIFLFQLVPYCFSTLAILICNILYRGDIASATIKLIKIEKTFFILNVEPKIRISIMKEAVMPLLVIFFSVAHLIKVRTSDISTLAMFMTFEYANLYFFSIEIIILFFLNAIHYYQCLLVDRVSTREPVLVKLCTIQDTLTDVIARIQKVYGLPLLCMVLSSFCFINVNLFLVSKIGYGPASLIIIGWITIVFMLIFRISLVCERIKEEEEEFYSVLYRIVKKEKNDKLLNNNYLRAHLLKKKFLSLNLAGFVEADMTLVAGVISATATYSVILIQMGTNF